MTLFADRVDHIYAIRTGDDHTSTYIGKATKPARALSHWLHGKGHNSRLSEEVALDAERGEWPELVALQLAVPDWEDLAIAETTVIDLCKDDRRFDSLNGNGGDLMFRPRKVLSLDSVEAGSLLLLWKNYEGQTAELCEVFTSIDELTEEWADGSHALYATAKFKNLDNMSQVHAGLKPLLAGPSGFSDWPAIFGSYFQQVNTYGLRANATRLPMPRAYSDLAELRELLGGSFLVANLSEDSLQDAGSGEVRRGIGAGITEESLRNRANAWWTPGSTGTEGGTLRRARDLSDGDANKPKYILAVYGQPRRRAILGIWPIAHSPWLADSDSRIEIPVLEPSQWTETQEKLLGILIGCSLVAPLNFNGRGLKWVQRPALDA